MKPKKYDIKNNVCVVSFCNCRQKATNTDSDQTDEFVYLYIYIYKNSQQPVFLHIPELPTAHPLPKTDKSPNQLPLLPFNSKQWPNELDSLRPDSHPPLDDIHASRWLTPQAPTHLITSWLIVWILARESAILAKKMAYWRVPPPRPWAGILQTEVLTVTVSSMLLEALPLSAWPGLHLSPRRNCMWAETIGLIECIPPKVLGYASLVYLIDDICLWGLCHAILITLLSEKWCIIQT